MPRGLRDDGWKDDYSIADAKPKDKVDAMAEHLLGIIKQQKQQQLN